MRRRRELTASENRRRAGGARPWRGAARRGAACVFSFALASSAAIAEPLDLRATPVTLSSTALDYGPTRYVGGFVLSSDHEQFGGLSGLLLDDEQATVVTDRGHVVRLTLRRAPSGRIEGVRAAEIEPLQTASGRALSGGARDSEALARGPDGRFWVAFEREHRMERYERLGGPAAASTLEMAEAGLAFNGGVEGLSRAPDGAIIAIAEDPVAGDARGDEAIVAWRITENGRRRFRLKRLGAFSPTGAAFGPDGALYVLERAFSQLLGVRMRIRRFSAEDLQTAIAAADDAPLAPGTTVVRLGTLSGVDNMEGVAAEAAPGGGVLLTVVSDDNFNVHQRTLLVQFLYRP